MRRLSYALIVGFIAAFALMAVHAPHGTWDAWAIWNATARLITYNDPVFVFQHAALPHPDYPPLLPLAVSYGYRVFGGYTPVVPILLQGVFYGLLLWFIRKPFWALAFIGALALPYALTQQADLPLAMVFLAAAVAYRNKKPPLWIGFALGIAILVKNEGELIALCFFTVWVIAERRIPWKALCVFAPFLLCLLLFRQVVTVPNDVVGSAGIFERLTDVSRYVVLIPLLVNGLVTFSNGAIFVLSIGLFLQRKRIVFTVPLITALLILCGYIAIYAITPHDIVWHVTKSFDRLLLHLFPVIVYELTSAMPQKNRSAQMVESILAKSPI